MKQFAYPYQYSLLSVSKYLKNMEYYICPELHQQLKQRYGDLSHFQKSFLTFLKILIYFSSSSLGTLQSRSYHLESSKSVVLRSDKNSAVGQLVSVQRTSLLQRISQEMFKSFLQEQPSARLGPSLCQNMKLDEGLALASLIISKEKYQNEGAHLKLKPGIYRFAMEQRQFYMASLTQSTNMHWTPSQQNRK